MPTTRILRGALGYAGAQANLPQPVEFQFNPEVITRTQVYSGTAVEESIRFELLLHALDGLAHSDPLVEQEGIYPQLAALEELLTSQRRCHKPGWLGWFFTLEAAPCLLLHYGERSIPVRLQRMHIREVIHNQALKPLHARVDVTLRVLSEHELRGNPDGLAALARYRQLRRQKAQLAGRSS